MQPDDDQLVPISALQHYAYCPRRCALIYVEQTFEDNVFTLRGRRVHETVHSGEWEARDGVRVERGLPLWCERLGLIGKADVVEFHEDGSMFPVEYKSGRRKYGPWDDLQLCGQALCLEEMIGQAVPSGALYYYASRRRRDVEFSEDLRRKVEVAAREVRGMLLDSRVPPAPNDDRCRDCSLNVVCVPELAGRRETLSEMLKATAEDEDPLGGGW